MIRKVMVIAWLALSAVSTQAWAEDVMRSNLVTLQTQVARHVPNDIIQALLAVEAEDQDPARLADTVNRTMAWALDAAKQAREVKVETGGYATQPVYAKNVLSHWRAIQELRLESHDIGALTRLIAKLQGRLQLKWMGFRVSPEQRRKVENELITEALNAFKERVGVARAGLGFAGYDIVDININTGGNEPRPMQTMRAMAAEVSAPALEAGTSEITVVVSGTVQME